MHKFYNVASLGHNVLFLTCTIVKSSLSKFTLHEDKKIFKSCSQYTPADDQ